MNLHYSKFSLEGERAFIPLFGLAVLFPIAFGFLNGLPNQLLVGTLVNSLLAISAFRFSWKKIALISIAPSIGAFASGIVFGSYTPFLLFLLPFIWLANLAFALFLKRFRGEGAASCAFKSALFKSLLLFASACALVFLELVPSSFLLAMGPVQFLTALSGLALAFPLLPFGAEARD